MITTENMVETRPDSLGHSILDLVLGSRALIVAAAAVPAALYMLYVYHYAVNVPFVDDWQVIPLVAAALHGHLDAGPLWGQYGDAREVMGRLVYIAFGLFDHLDERAVMLFSAALFVVSYVLVLLLFRSYLGRRLTPLPVLVVGIAWFSLVDFQSALWSTLVNNYLVLFFVVLAIYLLLVRRHDARLLFALGVLVAVMASLSFIEGFLVWPLGLICLLWSSSKRNKTELAIWVIAAALIGVAYFHGYDFANPACNPTLKQCSLTYGLSHPAQLIGYFVMLVGNVIPLSTTGIETHLWAHGLQGAVLLLAGILVVVQTLRERPVQPNPLPLLLTVFALLFDIVTALGRIGDEPQSAVSPTYDHYTMPNIILVVAIVIFVWAHAPKLHIAAGLRFVAFGTLTALLLIQCIDGTLDGISQSRRFHAAMEIHARIMVNLDRVPKSEKTCYIGVIIYPGWVMDTSWYRLARQNHLSAFQPGPKRHYRSEGLPFVSECI